MTITKLGVGVVGALFVALAGSAAVAAQSAGAYVCQTWNPSKNSPAVTHCVTWSKEAAARMHAAPCDPKTMTDAQMRARCAELTAEAERSAPPQAG